MWTCCSPVNGQGPDSLNSNVGICSLESLKDHTISLNWHHYKNSKLIDQLIEGHSFPSAKRQTLFNDLRWQTQVWGTSTSKKWALGFWKCTSMHLRPPSVVSIIVKAIEILPDDFFIELKGHSYLRIQMMASHNHMLFPPILSLPHILSIQLLVILSNFPHAMSYRQWRWILWSVQHTICQSKPQFIHMSI